MRHLVTTSVAGLDATVNFISTDLVETLDSFYTDSNSLEFMKRITNRLIPAVAQSSPSNFYPITSGIWIEDVKKSQQMIVMPSYSAGGSG